MFTVQPLRQAYLAEIKRLTPRDAQVNPMILGGWAECFHEECETWVRGRNAFVRVVNGSAQPGAYCSEEHANATQP